MRGNKTGNERGRRKGEREGKGERGEKVREEETR